MGNIKLRYFELDVARCFVMLVMPFIHVFEEAELWEFASPQLVQAVEWIVYPCDFGACVFMVVMGMNIRFTRRKETEPMPIFKRGLYLLLMAYSLNIVRYVIPAVGTSFFDGSDKDAVYYSIQYTLSPDIMNFASLAFFSFALFFFLKLSRTKILAIAALLMVVNDLLGYIKWNCPELLQVFVGNIFWTCDWSFFPLFSWLSFVSFGYYVAEYMMNIAPENHRLFWRKLALGSLAVLGVMWGLVSYLGMDFWLVAIPPLNDYITSTMTVIIDIASTNIVIWLLYELYSLFNWQRFNKYIQGFSENVNSFYIMQWIFVGWWEFIRFGMGYRYSADIGVTYYWVTAISICILSIIIAPSLRKHVLLPIERYIVS